MMMTKSCFKLGLLRVKCYFCVTLKYKSFFDSVLYSVGKLYSNNINNKKHKMSNKEIEKKQRIISKKLKTLSKKLELEGVKNYHIEARCAINKEYGKGWREEFEMQKTFKKGDFNMSYF